jgi:hypothetical protein
MNKLNALLIAIVATASMAFAQSPWEMTVTATQGSQGGAYEQKNDNNWTGAGFTQTSTVISNGDGYGQVTAFTGNTTNTTGVSNVNSGSAESFATGNMLTNFSTGGGVTQKSGVSFDATGTMNLGAASYLSKDTTNFVGALATTSGSFDITSGKCNNFPLGVYGNGQLIQSAFTNVSLGNTSFSATSTTSSFASACPVK